MRVHPQTLVCLPVFPGIETKSRRSIASYTCVPEALTGADETRAEMAMSHGGGDKGTSSNTTTVRRAQGPLADAPHFCWCTCVGLLMQ